MPRTYRIRGAQDPSRPDVTLPVETPLGYFIGTVEDKKAPEQKPLDTVKNEIATQLFLKEKAKAIAKAEADKAFNKLFKKKD